MSTKKNKERFSNSVRIENRRARHEYEILDKVEAGVVLTGSEVKSIRQGHASLNEVYAIPQGGEIWLRGMHIRAYTEAGREAPDPYRDRKLLLHRKELERWVGQVSQQGLTIVPLRLYFNERGVAKIEIGLARGKKLHDKRATMKERTVEREVRREHKLR